MVCVDENCLSGKIECMFEVITQSKYCAQKVLKNTDPNKRTHAVLIVILENTRQKEN